MAQDLRYHFLHGVSFCEVHGAPRPVEQELDKKCGTFLHRGGLALYGSHNHGKYDRKNSQQGRMGHSIHSHSHQSNQKANFHGRLKNDDGDDHRKNDGDHGDVYPYGVSLA